MKFSQFTYTFDYITAFVTLSLPPGRNNKYLGVHLYAYNSSCYPLLVSLSINGESYSAVSQLDHVGIRRIWEIYFSDPGVGLSSAPSIEVKVRSVTVGVPSGGDILWQPMTTTDDATFTFTPALSATASGKLITQYPWRFRWDGTEYPLGSGGIGPREGASVSSWLPVYNAEGTWAGTNSVLFDAPSSFFMFEEDANTYVYYSEYVAIATTDRAFIGSLGVLSTGKNMITITEKDETLNYVSFVLYVMYSGTAPELSVASTDFTDYNLLYISDVSMSYSWMGCDHIRMYGFLGDAKKGAGSIVWDAVIDGVAYCWMNVYQYYYDAPYIPSLLSVPAPYVYEDTAARGRDTGAVLPSCAWDVELKWLDSNGTPYILPFSMVGESNTAKMQTNGTYGGDKIIMLQSATLSAEEMRDAATIAESRQIAIKDYKGLTPRYPVEEWAWAAVEDISISDSGENGQNITINLLY